MFTLLCWLFTSQVCVAITHYSTHLNDNSKVPVFKKGAAFLFKYHLRAVTSESESKVRVFSPFSKIPEVNLSEVEHLLAVAEVQTTAVGGLDAQTSCYWENIKETYSLVVQQLEERVNLVKKEMTALVKDQSGLSEITKSFLPQIYRTQEASAPRKKLFVGAIAAIGAGAGLILGDPIKDAACIALSIFNMCSDNNQLSRGFEAVMDTHRQTILTLQHAQAKNDKIFSFSANKSKKHKIP